MTSITEWLASIGLDEYSQRFIDNGIDLSVVPDLTEQDLKDLGVLLGHRRKIMRAAAELDQTPATSQKAPASQMPSDRQGERRHLTVMFCDLVGSSALSARLDPEDMRRVISSYHACIGEVIGRYEGMIARYMGDGVLLILAIPAHRKMMPNGRSRSFACMWRLFFKHVSGLQRALSSSASC